MDINKIFIFLAKKNPQKLKNYRIQLVKWHSFRVITYLMFVVLIITLVDLFGIEYATQFRLDSVYVYSKDLGDAQSGINFLFNPLSYIVIAYFWFNRKKISKNDIFIGTNYFVFIIALIVLNLPSVAMGRVLYVFMVGAAILSSKFVLLNLRIGFIYLLIIIFQKFLLFSRPGGSKYLSLLLDGDYLNPVYGLLVMVSNSTTLFNF